VKDAAVVGKQDPYSGEVPLAFVVITPGTEASPQVSKTLQDFVRRHKDRTKWITGGVRFVDEIPKSAAGKILRRLLRDKANKEGHAGPRL
jgi:4-coumarate--CoA ligase